MQTIVAVRIQDDKFIPDSAAAKTFAAFSKTPHVTSETFDLIDQLECFKVVIRPLVHSSGALGIINNIIKLPCKAA